MVILLPTRPERQDENGTSKAPRPGITSCRPHDLTGLLQCKLVNPSDAVFGAGKLLRSSPENRAAFRCPGTQEKSLQVMLTRQYLGKHEGGN